MGAPDCGKSAAGGVLRALETGPGGRAETEAAQAWFPRSGRGSPPAGGGSVPPPPSGCPQVCRSLSNLWSCPWQTGVWADGGLTDFRMFLGPGCSRGPVWGRGGSPPPPGAPQRWVWVAWQVSAALGHTSCCGIPAPPALTGWVTLLSALAAHLPCPVAQGQSGEGTGQPSGGRPSHRGCRKAGAGLAPPGARPLVGTVGRG